MPLGEAVPHTAIRLHRSCSPEESRELLLQRSFHPHREAVGGSGLGAASGPRMGQQEAKAFSARLRLTQPGKWLSPRGDRS